jgi:CRP/FNR family transcriptional regulator
LRHLCVPQGLALDDLPKLDALICTARRVRRGAAVYRAGESFDNLYVARSGSLKMVMVSRNGREQVTGLLFTGDPTGLDGISTGFHISSAIALEDSSVCVIPYSPLKQLCSITGAMQDRLHRLMSEQLIRESSQMMVLGSLPASERVATLLLDLSERNGRRGYSHVEFNLRMTRDDIGSYLGVSLETVSRTLSRLQKRGLINVKGKLIRIVDLDGLRNL